MSDFHFNLPITTGVPSIGQGITQHGKLQQTLEPEVSFQEILQDQLEIPKTPEFSKHAAQRVAQRGIELSVSSMARLSQGVQMAAQKGIAGDTLILIDQTAFLVNIQNNKIITTFQSGELNGNVFTDIDGTVII